MCPGESTRPGTLLQVYHCHSGTNQLWYFLDMNNGYFQIKNVNSHLCFEIPSQSIRIEQASCIGYDSQQWQWQLVFTTPGGQDIFGLVNKAFPSQCLSLDGGYEVNDARLILADCHLDANGFGNGSQLWYLG
jgi:Ricin-type beta-trefoil lectin domain-like